MKNFNTTEVYEKLINNTALTKLEKKIMWHHYGNSDGYRAKELWEVAITLGLDLDLVEATHELLIEKFKVTARDLGLSWKGMVVE